MKEFIDFIKKLWQNRRTRALAILIMYVIFFIFVFSVITPSNKSVNTTDGTDSNVSDTTNDSTKDEFEYLNNIEIVSYYASDINNNIIDNYNTNLVNGNIIYTLVKNSVLESTNYINNTNTYYISVKDYESLINNATTEIECGIRIIISDNNIILDFTEYYGYKINVDIRS